MLEVRKSKVRDSGMVPCEDDHVDGHGRENCELDVRYLRESDRDGSDRCGYGRGGYARDGYVRGGCDRDGRDRDGNGREEGDRDVSDCDENDLRGRVRRASAHAHDARARRLSCQ